MESLDKSFVPIIKQLIAEDEIPKAIVLLRQKIEDDKRLSEVLLQSGRFQYVRQQIRLGIISLEDAQLTQNQIRFGLLDLLQDIEQDGEAPLPKVFSKKLITDNVGWTKNLHRELLNRKVAVGNDPKEIISHYGWLIEECLRKLLTEEGESRNLVRLTYLTEVFQSSLRYLCFIQMAQLLQLEEKPEHPIIAEFLNMEKEGYITFDYLNLLMVTTEILIGKNPFMPELENILEDLYDVESNLYKVVIFLGNQRTLLLHNKIEEGKLFDKIMDEYLTGLVLWLRKISFLANYRLVSMKEIVLNYRLGTSKNFVHIYGELNGLYKSKQKIADPQNEEYISKTIENIFTYNHSVLLFAGNNIETCLDNIENEKTYISLTPFVVDKSVLDEKPKQTPEIYYYTAAFSDEFHFAKYQNEMNFHSGGDIGSNQWLVIKYSNEATPMRDELYEYMEKVFSNYNATAL